LQNHAALLCPIALQDQDKVLKARCFAGQPGLFTRVAGRVGP
jgi:hypothetical protein